MTAWQPNAEETSPSESSDPSPHGTAFNPHVPTVRHTYRAPWGAEKDAFEAREATAELKNRLSIHRIAAAADHAAGQVPFDLTVLQRLPAHDLTALHSFLNRHLPKRVMIAGSSDRRLVLIENATRPGWTIADLSGQAHSTREWPVWTRDRIHPTQPDSWLADADLSSSTLYRLARPRVLLVALYHPEYFPLPRFPLAISDLARAARATLLGQVELIDMQLGATLKEISARVLSWAPDVVGVSATFGQHDLMTALLDQLSRLAEPPLIVVGGSLTVRNEKLLLQRYPRLLVARGAGEPTMQDVLAHWHGDLPLEQVRGIGYHKPTSTPKAGNPRRTPIIANRLQTDIWPELDLLEPTFAKGGVAQLETSRGCTSTCSFCPRGHKGQWAGAAPESLAQVVGDIGAVFDRHPDISRTLYLVDEEFIGRDEGAVSRALAIAETLHAHRFTWETSCRIDQVVWPSRDRAWHIDRGCLWRSLVDKGLRRCLFGVESGVTSILERFHKETTGEQNALAIRTLSALGVPTRFTYITFDHLMSTEELRATYAFQARTDLLLRPLPELTVEEIIDGIHDDRFAAAHSLNTPFYAGISYLLVSMECLIGAAYTHKVTSAGLARQARPSMGSLDADFADPRIGVLSLWAQRWIDRNFALDYTLKSLEKVLNGPARHAVRDARAVLKRAAFLLLGDMINLLDRPGIPLADLDSRCRDLADAYLIGLHPQVQTAASEVCAVLSSERAKTLRDEYGRWAAAGRSWQLINAADPCGT